MKSRYKIPLLMILLVLTLVTGISLTYAWLTDSETTGPISFQIGEVKYLLQPDPLPITAETPVVPGQPLITTSLLLQNFSSVNSEIRVRIHYSYIDEMGLPSTVDKIFDQGCATNDVTKEIHGVMDAKWVYHTIDEAWYFIGDAVGVTEALVGSSSPTTHYIVAPSIEGGIPFAFLTELHFNGAVVGNTWANQNVTITFTFEAKQADYATWVDMGSFSFETGV